MHGFDERRRGGGFVLPPSCSSRAPPLLGWGETSFRDWRRGVCCCHEMARPRRGCVVCISRPVLTRLRLPRVCFASQRDNFDYFMTVAMGLDNRMYKPRNIDFVIVQSGTVCSPCARLEPLLRRSTTLAPGVTEAFEAPGITLLRRSVNEGMDFASHNTTLTHLLTRAQLSRYRYVFFLNSSIRGPFVPTYLPQSWQWTDSFLSLMNDQVHVVSSSLVCLPEVDAGGYGPKLESWAFAADRDGLDALLQEDLFQVRQCKLCKCVPKPASAAQWGAGNGKRTKTRWN